MLHLPHTKCLGLWEINRSTIKALEHKLLLEQIEEIETKKSETEMRLLVIISSRHMQFIKMFLDIKVNTNLAMS